MFLTCLITAGISEETFSGLKEVLAIVIDAINKTKK
jgi:hypothetical protein